MDCWVKFTRATSPRGTLMQQLQCSIHPVQYNHDMIYNHDTNYNHDMT